jgi:hypothetical protein
VLELWKDGALQKSMQESTKEQGGKGQGQRKYNCKNHLKKKSKQTDPIYFNRYECTFSL